VISSFLRSSFHGPWLNTLTTENNDFGFDSMLVSWNLVAQL